MKTTVQKFYGLLLTGLLFTGFAIKAQNNNLVVFSQTGDRFYLILNGMKYNDKPETNVKVTGLASSNYKAKIIFENKHPDLDGTIHIIWEGQPVNNKEFTYAVERKGEKYKLKFIGQTDMNVTNPYAASAVAVPAIQAVPATPENTQVTAVNVPGMSTTVTTTTTSATNGNMGMNVNVNGMNVNITTTGMPDGSMAVTTTTTTTTYNSSSSPATAYNPPPVAAPVEPVIPGGCVAPMNDGDFKSIENAVKAETFEDNKLTVVKQAISGNCVTSHQVRRLMDLFSYEDSKLQLTKYSYDYTFDKNNYYKVNSGFGYSASVDELNNYIKAKK